jgi:hypothetical protein
MRLALGVAVPDHVSRTVGTPPPITSPRWIEPDESLDPGEYLLGGSTSTNLARGRLIGYGLYFTNRRIIGVKRKGIGLAILIVATGLIAAYLIFTLFFSNPFLGFLSVPLPALLDPASRYLTQKFGEKFLSRSDKNISGQLKRKRDFETKREDISALYLSKSSKKAWKLDIVFQNREKKDIRINISGGKHYQILRDLVDAFSRIQPTIYFREY